MKKLISISALAAAVCLQSGCAMGPKLDLQPPEKMAETLQGQTIRVKSTSSTLQVKSKSAAVVGFLAGLVLPSLLGGGGNVGSPSELQTNLDIQREFGKNVSSAATSAIDSLDARSGGAIAKAGPIQYVRPAVEKDLKEHFAATLVEDPKQAVDYLVDISQPSWLVDFSMASSDYTLSHHVSMLVKDGANKKILLKEECVGQYPQKYPRSVWSADNYAKVARASQEVAQKCYQQFARALHYPARDLSFPEIQTEAATTAAPPASAASPASAAASAVTQ